MKNNRILLFLLTLILAVIPSTLSHAAVSDDPGNGRLSGKYIPEEFYEDVHMEQTPSLLKRYGGFQTANPYTNKTYTHQDRFDGMSVINGVDVSEYQKDINWTAVKSAGIDFAFIRTGGRGWGKTGSLYTDAYYDKNMTNAVAAGVKVGIYVFSQATTEAEAVEEAQLILNRIGSYKVELPLVLDYEFASTGTAANGRLKDANLSKDAATAICMAFCKKIAEAGYTPMVYANPDMLNNHLNPAVISASYPIWLANYTTSTGYAGAFQYWQYSSTGAVSGISGNVDMNYYYTASGDISGAVITPIAAQIYTGNAITPAFSVTLNGKTLTENADYTVAYSENVNVGTATITLTGINGYNGTRVATFQIGAVPAPTLGLVTRTTSYIKMSWDKQSDVTGYEIFRSTSPNGTYKQLKTCSSATTSYKNSKLTAGQCYYYKIRSYIQNGTEKRYSEFSPVAAYTTKASTTKLAIAKSGTTVYDSLSTGGNAVATPAQNSIMTVLYSTYADDGSAWYCVSTSGTQGFVPASTVTIAKQGQIKTSKVNVRKSASVTSKRLTRLAKGKKVTVLSKKTAKGMKWYKVTFTKKGKTYNGFICTTYVKII